MQQGMVISLAPPRLGAPLPMLILSLTSGATKIGDSFANDTALPGGCTKACFPPRRAPSAEAFQCSMKHVDERFYFVIIPQQKVIKVRGSGRWDTDPVDMATHESLPGSQKASPCGANEGGKHHAAGRCTSASDRDLYWERELVADQAPRTLTTRRIAHDAPRPRSRLVHSQERT